MMNNFRWRGTWAAAACLAVSVVCLGEDEKKIQVPRLGNEAPTFKLKSFDGKSEMDLASFRGKRPVVLFFGSYT